MAAPVAAANDGQADINTAVYVDEIRPGAEGSILVCGEGSRHPICVIQNCSEFVYIYENTIRKLALLGIVRLPSGCQCMCVSKDPQGREHLVFCLKDGRVIQQNVQSFKEETRAKKRKKFKKDKHKVQVPLPGGGGDCPPGNQEIFDDLLSEGNPSSSAAHPTDIIQDQSLAKVVALGDDRVIFNQPNVQDVMFVNGCLITCAECTSGWKLSVYRQRGTTSPPHDASANHFEFNKSPEFETVLHGRPISSKSQGDSSFFDSRRPSLHIGETYMEEEPNMRENTEEEPNMQEKPQLFCVISQSMLGKEKTTIANFSKTLTLEDSLYKNLFCSNFNLLNAPILLISLPNGYIYKFPLRPNRSTPSELDPTGSNWYRQWTRVFWVSDQPVAFISGLRAVPNQTEQNDFSSSCLCILGRYGQVVCFTENNYADQQVGQREKWKYTIKSFNHGTVQTACKTRTRQGILYSTGKEIHCLSLSKSEASDSSTTEDSVSCSPLLGVAEIRALAELGRPKTDDTPRQMPGNSQLVALTVSGSVLKLSLPPVGSRGNTTQSITAAAAGKRVQESLQALNNISARSCELAKRGETQDLILREVCKACHLATMLLSECKLSGSSRLFKVDTNCIVRNNGMLCDMELLCKVTNRSQLSLSHGWALTVSMETASEQTKVAEGSKCSVTKSVQLVDFQDGQTVEVILPLLDGKVSLSLPVNIQTCLHFSPREYMSWLLPEKNINAGSRIDLGESGISLPLNEPRVIDLMTVLRPVQEDAADVQGDRVAMRQCQMTTNSGSDWLASALQDTATLRHSTYQTAPATAGTSDKSVDVCITLGSDVRTMIFKKHKNDGCSRQEQVLNWLLEDNKFTTQSTNPISLRTRDGKVVTFEVKGQQRRQSGAGRGSEIGEAVKVVVKAPDYPTLTQLQLAVNQRIKVILEREGSDVGITATQEQLQNELSKVKTLQKNLQKNQDAASQDQPSSTQWHTNAQSTLKLYQQLRTKLNFL